MCVGAVFDDDPVMPLRDLHDGVHGVMSVSGVWPSQESGQVRSLANAALSAGPALMPTDMLSS
jgi:hypothetical protein